jgi:hypothetical protein
VAKTSTSFKEGKTKTGGRQKGSQNKMTQDIKRVINKLLSCITDSEIVDLYKRVKKNKPEVIFHFLSKIAPKDLSFSGEVNHNININMPSNADKLIGDYKKDG